MKMFGAIDLTFLTILAIIFTRGKTTALVILLYVSAIILMIGGVF